MLGLLLAAVLVRVLALLASLIVVIVVIVVVRGDLALLLEVEHEAQHRYLGRAQRVHRLLKILLPADASGGNENNAAGPTAEYDGVVGNGEQRGIDDHVI